MFEHEDLQSMSIAQNEHRAFVEAMLASLTHFATVHQLELGQEIKRGRHSMVVKVVRRAQPQVIKIFELQLDDLECEVAEFMGHICGPTVVRTDLVISAHFRFGVILMEEVRSTLADAPADRWEDPKLLRLLVDKPFSVLDCKPDNVMLNDTEREWFLVDFGCIRAWSDGFGWSYVVPHKDDDNFDVLCLWYCGTYFLHEELIRLHDWVMLHYDLKMLDAICVERGLKVPIFEVHREGDTRILYPRFPNLR